MRLVMYFVTRNLGKIKEVSRLLPSSLTIRGLADLKEFAEIPETSQTIKGNALQKARYVFDRHGVDCFADDSGLIIDALNGAPGVDSAHYAGPSRDTVANIDLVLKNLEGIKNRTARFQTIIALILQGKEYVFEGIVHGDILLERKGTTGFGYDPIFKPSGHHRSFAEFSLDEKNLISHRAIATNKLVAFLKKMQ